VTLGSGGNVTLAARDDCPGSGGTIILQRRHGHAGHGGTISGAWERLPGIYTFRCGSVIAPAAAAPSRWAVAERDAGQRRNHHHGQRRHGNAGQRRECDAGQRRCGRAGQRRKRDAGQRRHHRAGQRRNRDAGQRRRLHRRVDYETATPCPPASSPPRRPRGHLLWSIGLRQPSVSFPPTQSRSSDGNTPIVIGSVSGVNGNHRRQHLQIQTRFDFADCRLHDIDHPASVAIDPTQRQRRHRSRRCLRMTRHRAWLPAELRLDFKCDAHGHRDRESSAQQMGCR